MSEIIQDSENSHNTEGRKFIKFIAFYEIALATIFLYILTNIFYDFLLDDLPEGLIDQISGIYPYMITVSIFSFFGGLFLLKDKQHGKSLSVIAQIATFFFLKEFISPDFISLDWYHNGCKVVKVTFENILYIWKTWSNGPLAISMLIISLSVLLIVLFNKKIK